MKINKYCADSCLFHWANPSHATHRTAISAVFRPRELNFSSVWILREKDSDHVHLLKSREVWVELEALWFLLANSSVLNLWVLKTQLRNQSRNQSDSCSTSVVHDVFCLEWQGPGQPNLFSDTGELSLLESKCNFAQHFPKLLPIFQGLL